MLSRSTHGIMMLMGSELSSGSTTVTLVLTRRVKPGCEADFQAWLARIVVVEREAEGFLGREELPPVDGYQDWWTSLVRFEDEQKLEAWMESTKCRQLVAEAEPLCSQVRKSRIGSSFDGWFPGSDVEDAVPPTWKMTMAVVLALYPSIFLITWVFTRHVDWPYAMKLLVTNILAVSVVSWISMPIARRLLGRWLAPTSNCSLGLNVGGGIAIGLVLLVLLWIFLLIPMG